MLVAAVDDEVADIWDPGEGVGEDEDGIVLVAGGVGEEEEGTEEAEPPEEGGDDDALVFFGGVPLDQEAGEEGEVAEPTDRFPGVPVDAEELAVEPEEICERGHRDLDVSAGGRG